jgi:hypothetical protein
MNSFSCSPKDSSSLVKLHDLNYLVELPAGDQISSGVAKCLVFFVWVETV